MKNYIRILTVITALMFGAVSGAWAQLAKSDVEIEVKPSASAGEVAVSTINTREVTLTVAPASGYYIKASDIVVEKLVNTGNANAPKRRSPEIADVITGKMYNADKTKEISSIEGGSTAKYVFTVPAGYDGVYVTASFVEGNIIRITTSTNLGDSPNMAAHYILVDDVSADVVEKLNNSTAFSGTFEADINPETKMPYRITGLSAPLFNTLTGTVKNLVLEDVGISNHDGNTGAIACTANGAARIYNVGILSGSVGGTGNTGGLVGFLDGTARVVNCYSYANITSGTNKGGIVGNNNVASTQSNVATMVMNCMFYGTIATGGTVSPVYGGQNIDNKNSGGLATYNYYLYRTDLAITKDKYNCALAVEEKFLNRFEIFRQLENSNKKLASIYATGSADDADQKMLKWVLETADKTIENPKPYPVLKAQDCYPSIINYDAENASDSTTVGRNHGGKLDKTLLVTISGVGSNAPAGASITTGSLTLTRTDKDFDRFNFNYDKVQLPYYNDVGTKNYTGNRVVTGWKITAIDGGTAGTFNREDAWGGYNFADRKCTNKDLYSESGRVFSQGAYFDVPYGVTAITIEPYWGVAAYVSDQYYDVVYKEQNNNNYAGQSVNVSSAGLGTQATNNTDIIINGSTQKVYTSINDARTALNIPTDVNSGKTVYDYAVVLVGNVHQAGPLSGDYTPYTITSVDLDKDNEPDYSFIFSHYDRQDVSPIRFDFLNVVGTAQAQKPNGTSRMLNVSIFKPKGWFEVTNTCSIYFVQFEGDNGNKTSAPIILLGGAFDQFTSTQSQKVTTSQQYIHLGSNCWFKAFGNGTHSDGFSFTKHVPVSVTGGDFDGFYLSGVYRPDAGIDKDDAECYISSGRFNEVAGAAQQMIDGDVRWQIYNADITNFYGGGINAAKPITGDITVDIFNSHVDTYCGGPKFGDMQKNGTTFTTTYSKNKEGSSTGTYSRAIAKDGKVTTNATGCWFNKFFGAGYGGTSYSELKFADATSYNFTTLANNYTDDRGKYFTGTNTTYKSDYGNKGPGVATDFSYEFFIWSRGQVGARFYVKYASFSLAQCNDVESKLKKCVIENNFYGGGSIGKVAGTATSELENCEVKGSVYGGGYSASLPTIPVRSGGFTTIPNFNNQSGMFEPGVLSDTEDFDWTSGTLTENTTALNTEGGKHDIYTDADLKTLGEVANTVLTIKGNTTVAESVYGGGEESNVEGNTQVNITGGTISENVFGGGKGEADEFSCSKAMIGVNNAGAGADLTTDENKNKGTKVTISNGQVNGNVYGGGEVGRVEWNTQVTIGAGEGTPIINGSVFGAGAGVATHGYAALVRGNSTVTVQGNAKVLQNVYGGGEQATVGRYWVKGVNDNVTGAPTAPTDTPDEMPYQTMSGGKCTVVVQGSAQVGPDSNVPITAGHVFGAGKGVVTPNYVHTGDKANWSKRMVDYNSTKHTSEGKGTTWDYYEAYTKAQIADTSFPKYVWEYFVDDADQSAANYKSGEDKYFEFLQTLALVTGTDVTIGGGTVKGSVFGGSESGYVQDDTDVKVNGGTIGTTDLGGAYYGNVYGGGKGDAEHTGANQNYVAAGLVKGNTKVTISNGTILHNVYGGGAYGSVGEFTYVAGMPTERVQNTTGGKAEVIITGGTIGTTGEENGMVFGSSRGDVGAPGAIHDKLAWVYNTEVKIGTEGSGSVFTTPTIKGSIYGGGENGHNLNNADVYIYSGTVGIPSGETIGDYSGAAYPYRGNVYGGGCGTDKYWTDANNNNVKDAGEEHYNSLAGIVWGNTSVNISGGHVVRNVYGAGAMGSVGTAADATSGKTTITVTGGRIGYDGNSNNDGNIFGAARGDLAATDDNLAQVRETEVNINYATTPTADNEDKNVQLIAGSVFGGGEAGKVKGSVAVNMTGGLVLKDVYGGGALADTQSSNWDATANENAGGWANETLKSALNTTTVRLTGGTILGEAYGGGLGQKNGVNGATSDIAAYVYGDVLLDLNGTTTSGETGAAIDNTAKGCVVGQVFGCNNINGSPKGDVMVHVYATQNAEATQIANTPAVEASETNPAVAAVENAKVLGRYDVSAVYGGGNMAAYVPVTPYNGTSGSKTQVIIEGCTLTSIETVYGGGNAAAVPETNVVIKGAYEIGYLFGGGNGKDDLPNGDPNPGADIGQYHNGTEMVTYGTGNANSLMEAGLIHEAYGGSNTKGVLKGSINQESAPKNPGDEGYCCELVLDKIVGAGKYADIDGDVNMTLSCQPSTKVPLLFAGADEANVNGNITLNITNGNFGKVFGGNNLGGAVKGKITVNVEETGCQPIKIDELYLGGNEAAYSIYGYYESEDIQTETGKKILKPRTAEMYAITDPTAEGYKAPVANPTEDATHTFPYAQPELNIISCTYIGEVFGGGLGAPATMYANPSVNINMVKGDYGDNATIGVPAMMTEKGLPSSDNTNHLGIIGNVYGGGQEASVIGETHVNIGTEQTVGTLQAVLGAYITGNVYGGGKLANVGEMDADIDNITAAGRTFVNIGAKKTTVNNQEVWQAVAAGKGVTIKGNVYGGGKGEATTFKCEKAIVAGSTNVMIGNGAVNGVVYGGGQLGRVETGTTVTIGIGDGVAEGTPTSEPQINGDVYGAGAGVNTHGYAALVRGISEVTIQGNAKVGRSVYGGGQIASVGRYKVKKGQGDPSDAPNDVEIGMPYTLADSESKCIVTVKGYAEIGPDNMQMKATGGPDDTGYVFGAGKGVLPYEGYAENEDPVRWTIDDDGNYVKEEYKPENEDLYLKYVGTLALATETEVTIGGHAFVKGSVYGGSENGHVQHDTNVKIEGNCQIGNGWNTTTSTGVNARYNENLFVNPATDTAEQIEAAAASIYECAHWDYTNPYTPYDKNGAAGGGATTATDGHTFYGNVFGGGSGLYPYKSRKYKDADDNYIFEWLRTAGRVVGNTNVIITGGHILTSVYGGCELTDVGNGVSVETNKGRCFVKMSGGTLGVPRTLAQIAAHPVTCYLFGAGKGDQRVHFNQWTNVGKVRVEINDSISQPIIYGSVFGGGEDGHVLGDVSIDIKKKNSNDPVIGTWGTSYVDGNVFGGGRGFGGDALSAGVVSGNVNINISGGKMLGSIYGGGRLGSVGTYLVPSDKTQKYGQFIPDGKQQTINEVSIGNGDVDVSDATGVTHGHVTINISGGTIGNRYEYAYYAPNTTIDKSTNHIPYTEFDATSNRLTHTKGGNVFAGAMGRFYGLDGSTVLPRWIDLGKVKSTKLNISGSAVIKSSIYGGGELGWTSGTHKTSDNKDVSTEISITGGTIGSEITDNNVVQYTYGSVFGGGYGSAQEMLTDANSNKTYPKFQAGRVMNSTAVTMSSGTVKASVYGGGELANVGYGFYSYSQDELGETAITQASDAANTYVTVSGGTIGRAPITAQTGNTYFGGATMGNVYGGGSGNKTISRCGLVLGNTYVNISGTNTRIYHNVYGGGAYGSVGDYEYTTGTTDPNYPNIVKVFGINGLHTSGTGTANVSITGGIIGYDGKDNGMVFGSSRGDVQGEDSRDDYMAWVNDAFVTIGTSNTTTGPDIRGSVYGSGENGHVFHDTDVKIYSGTIGIDNAGTSVEGYTVTSSGTTYNGPEYPSRGNVYGGGCGTDTYTKNDKEYFNPTAGIVKGNTNVTMTGGHVVRAVYGGGSMGSVGTFTSDADSNNDIQDGKPISCATNTGKCTVVISGGKIGPTSMSMPNYYGNVFGAGRGEMHDPADYPNLETSAYFNETEVTITGTAFVKGSVYGGAESGHVLGNTLVQVSGGQIGCGVGKTAAYTADEWAAASSSTLAPCASWTYTANGNGAPYDPNAGADNYDSKGGATTATDGHTFYGNVFGGGSGSIPYAAGKWLPTAGCVEGNTSVEIKGGHILTSVYGGNECTDVFGSATISMTDGTVGVPRTQAQIESNPVLGHIYGAGKGDKRVLFNTWTNVASTSVSLTGGKVYGSVYGGGEDGHVIGNAVTTINGADLVIGCDGTSGYDGNVFGGGQGSSTALTAGVVGGNVTLNIQNGTMKGSVYGGGRLAAVGTFFENPEGEHYGDLHPDHPTDHGNISVNLTGGTIYQDVFGGGMGVTNVDNADRFAISRNATVHLNENVETTAKGCIVKGRIFGANNANASPKGDVLVHIHATQSEGTDNIATKAASGYDVDYVFGGGNNADYVPTVSGAKQSTEVIIEGCDLTSIEEVYGGGFGAATPGTKVEVRGTKIINNLFGGGYGAGENNPGANVGFRTAGKTPYANGAGKAVVQLMAGTVNNVYGGSNTNGDIRGGSSITNVPTEWTEGDYAACCPNLKVGEIYGGGKSAPMEGGAEIVLGCMPDDWIGEIYAGAQAADVGNDVSLTLTSGKFERVFGGNNVSGTIDGSIEVNIEECPTCGTPIIIGELYGGGNQAPYDIDDDYTASDPNYPSPRVNVRSFTSIGTIYGGGLGETAVVKGNPMVNINVGMVRGGGQDYNPDTDSPSTVDVRLYPHEQGKIGVIGNVFGGGNAASVEGNTYVNIGVQEYVKLDGIIAGETNVAGYYTRSRADESSPYVYTKVEPVAPETEVIAAADTIYYLKVEGADIRGNVYGGGNNAEVTGNTNVNIGKKSE